MLTASLASAPHWALIALALSLVIAGIVKGTIGVGMPIVAFPLISMLVDVQAAVMLLTMPLILSNIPQALEGGETVQCFFGLLPVLGGMFPGILLGIAVLLQVTSGVSKLLAGIAVIFVAVLMFAAPKFQIKGRARIPAGIGAGFFGGLLGGVAAMPGPPVFTFILAKGLRGQAFTKEASLFLVLSAALMAAIFASSRKFDGTDLVISTVALAPVGLGMYFGRKLREAIPADAFRKVVLIVVLVSGLQLVYRGLFS
jgi:uncharacterized membrane protein YfcA